MGKSCNEHYLNTRSFERIADEVIGCSLQRYRLNPFQI